MVLYGHGINCEKETKYSWELAGAEAELVHVNELVWGEKKLEDYHILTFPGGFSYGDDHGAGTLLSGKIKSKKGDELIRFVEEGGLVLGICNGCQIITDIPLVPDYEHRKVALLPNENGNFVNNTVNLVVNRKSPCVYTKDIDEIDLVVRHAEGRFYAIDSVINNLFETNQVVMQYVEGPLTKNDPRYGPNPNGSKEYIAGICDSTGRVFGLMPHPEAQNSYLNHPHWTIKKEVLKRRGEKIPEEGDGIKIFRNGVEYIMEEFS